MKTVGFFVQITAFIWLLLAGALLFRGGMTLFAAAHSSSEAETNAIVESVLLTLSAALMFVISWKARKIGLRMRAGASIKNALAAQ